MLIAAPDRWDEACFAVPAVRGIIGSGLKVGILCQQSQRAFWETLPGLHVIEIPEKMKAKAIASGISRGWEASLTWELSDTAEIFKLAGIPKRLGVDSPKLKKWLTHPLEIKADPLEHRVQFYLAVAEKLGIPTSKPELFAPADIGVPSNDEAVLLCPDSDFGANHEWPLERWLEIARDLTERGKCVAVASSINGRGLGQSLVARLSGAAELMQLESLSSALPLLASYRTVIAADGSIPHLASHAGATCITLFGPNDPGWKRPLGRRHAVVKQHAECAPCFSPKCQMDLRCQQELSASRVLSAVRGKLASN